MRDMYDIIEECFALLTKVVYGAELTEKEKQLVAELKTEYYCYYALEKEE